MTEDGKPLTGFDPGRGYEKSDWESVSDTPELTDAELRQARPFAEVFPDLAAGIRRGRGRPPSESVKTQITLRLDPEVIERFKADGPGWQSRINAVLRKAVGLDDAA